MSGMVYIAVGFVILAASTAGLILLEVWLRRKKREIRQQTYQIYD